MLLLRSAALLTVACLAATSIEAQPAAERDTLRSTVLLASRPSGIHQAWSSADGSRWFHFEFNDRGRGPSLDQRVVFGSDGYPSLIEITGHDYFKAPVAERFVLEQRGEGWLAAWRSKAESASVRLPEPLHYLPFDDAGWDVLEPALLAADGKPIRILPQGEIRLERVRELRVTVGASSRVVTLYATHGFGFAPWLWWADETDRPFATGSSWFMLIREGWEAAQPQLLGAQAAYDSARAVSAARSLARRPTGPVVFRNATVFDAGSGRLRPGLAVIVRDGRVAEVTDNRTVTVPAGAEVIDVAGRTLMPGMWDMHVHTADQEGVLHLAAGVTTVRDLANDAEEAIARRRRMDEGTLLGPRILLAGFIDGPGPFAGPTKVLVAHPDSARAWVNWYADRGYDQIKIYSSVEPSLVPVIIDAAHRRGMRVSGHVPQGMTAEEFVRAGADELQHVNFLFLNFWRDSVTDTRTPERFTAPAERAALLDLQSARVRNFIALLRERGTVIDPTLVAFEGMITGRRGSIDPSYAAIAHRLPPTVRRGFLGGGLPVPPGMDQRYRDSFAAFKRMVKAMYDAGVPIVAGTDALPGFAYHRELELYAEAGIPNAEVLRIATIGAARIAGRDQELGSIAPGKLADIIIIDGNPVDRISDIRRVALVMKDGVLYDPAALYRSVGVEPSEAALP